MNILVEGGGRLAQARQLFERPEVGFVLIEELAQHFFGEDGSLVLLGEDLGRGRAVVCGRVQLELGEPPQALHQVTLAAGARRMRSMERRIPRFSVARER